MTKRQLLSWFYKFSTTNSADTSTTTMKISRSTPSGQVCNRDGSDTNSAVWNVEPRRLENTESIALSRAASLLDEGH